MPSFGVKITHIPRSINESEFKSFLGSTIPPLPPILSTHLKDVDEHIPKKYAFINFSTIEEAQLAVDIINKLHLKGERLFAKIQGSQLKSGHVAERKFSSSSDLQKDSPRTIKVSGLPSNYTEMQLEEVCSKFGGIDSIRICQGKPVYAYITFSEGESANTAVCKVNNSILEGRSISAFLLPSNKSSSFHNVPSQAGKTATKEVNTKRSLFQPLSEGLTIRRKGIRNDSRQTPSCKDNNTDFSFLLPQTSGFSLDHIEGTPVTHGGIHRTLPVHVKRQHSDSSTDSLPDYQDDPSEDNLPSKYRKSEKITDRKPVFDKRKKLGTCSNKLVQSPQKLSSGKLSVSVDSSSKRAGQKHLFDRLAIETISPSSQKQKLLSSSITPMQPQEISTQLSKLVGDERQLPKCISDQYKRLNETKAAGELFPRKSFLVPDIENPNDRNKNRQKCSISSSSKPLPVEIRKVAKLQLRDPLVGQLLVKNNRHSVFVANLQKKEHVTINVSEMGQHLVISGEKTRIERASKELQKRVHEFTAKIRTRSYAMDVMYAPLFSENSDFTTKISELAQTHGVEFFVTQIMPGHTRSEIQIEQIVQELKDYKSLLTISRLLSKGLVFYPYQWYIQDKNSMWHLIPDENNKIFNDNLLNSCNTFECEDNNVMFKISLHDMIATNPCTGYRHPLKTSFTRTAWYQYQDDHFGFVPCTDEDSRQIEQCFQTRNPKIESSECYYNFQSMLMIDLSNKSITGIKRDPMPSCNELNPTVSVVIKGLESDLKSAEEAFDDLLQTKRMIEIFPNTVFISCPSILQAVIRKYCVQAFHKNDSIEVHGVEKYTSIVILEAIKSASIGSKLDLSMDSTTAFTTPLEWEMPSKNTELKLVRCGSDEWNKINSLWHKTMRQKIIKVERVQNIWLWRQYALRKERMIAKNGEKYENEKRLFHGTKHTNPLDIYNSEKGFDFRFSRPGMWGHGSYFAENANYSAKHYGFEIENGSKQLFLAKVLVGNFITLQSDRSLRMPPLKPGSSERYDSVNGFTNGSNVYVVYEHDKAYPDYLITY